ncbi:hypothetical protein MKW98_008945, partial [Papaver atlanticum]
WSTVDSGDDKYHSLPSSLMRLLAEIIHILDNTIATANREVWLKYCWCLKMVKTCFN